MSGMAFTISIILQVGGGLNTIWPSLTICFKLVIVFWLKNKTIVSIVRYRAFCHILSLIEGENNEIHDDVLVALHDSHASGLGDGCLDVHLLSNSHYTRWQPWPPISPLLVSSQISRGHGFTNPDLFPSSWEKPTLSISPLTSSLFTVSIGFFGSVF